MDNYITTSEIARNLKISKVTLWKLRKENKTFPKAIICGKRKMIFNFLKKMPVLDLQALNNSEELHYIFI